MASQPAGVMALTITGLQQHVDVATRFHGTQQLCFLAVRRCQAMTVSRCNLLDTLGWQVGNYIQHLWMCFMILVHDYQGVNQPMVLCVKKSNKESISRSVSTFFRRQVFTSTECKSTLDTTSLSSVGNSRIICIPKPVVFPVPVGLTTIATCLCCKCLRTPLRKYIPFVRRIGPKWLF